MSINTMIDSREVVVIVGTARNDGDAYRLANVLHNLFDWKIVHVTDYSISAYDYQHKNADDDFIPLMEELIGHHHMFIFLTPVYWYSMSGQLKIFFDRLTDLMEVRKDLGKRLKGKKMAVITTSNGGHLGSNFWHPFIHTAKYFDMEYCCGMHTLSNLHSHNQAIEFGELLQDHFTQFK